MKKNVILGINVSHNASASLMINDEIVLCVQEERFTNKKNFFGYPKKSIDYCIIYTKKKGLTINLAVFTTQKLPPFSLKFPIHHFFSIKDFINYFGESYYGKKLKGLKVDNYFKELERDLRNSQNLYLPVKNVR
mgnify:CR=1 FL=1